MPKGEGCGETEQSRPHAQVSRRVFGEERGNQGKRESEREEESRETREMRQLETREPESEGRGRNVRSGEAASQQDFGINLLSGPVVGPGWRLFGVLEGTWKVLRPAE